jgi:enoyl-[acyl-carrier protein] reductase I
MKLLDGKKVLILGVANDMSIAWGITKQMKKHGAKVALSFVSEALKKRVQPLADEIGADFTFELNVQNDEHLENMAKTVKEEWGTFDVIIHSLAFAARSDLKGGFLKTSREGYSLAMDVSAYSLVAVVRSLKELMNPGASVTTMTYYGADKVVQNYNVMGPAKAALEANVRYLAYELATEDIRVNAISAGPIKTLASSGIAGFREKIGKLDDMSPMNRITQPEEVGGATVFLASDLASGVTGQTIFVDTGMSIMAGF